MPTPKKDYLNRFTTIPFVIDLLTRHQLTLLNPNTWEDYNDRITMERYRIEKKKEAVYALCLTDKRETVHHWNAFANGTSGCCIEFDKIKLFEYLNKVKSVIHGKSVYVKINNLSQFDDDIEKLPYLKREPFEPESEYRIIALSSDPQQPAFDIPIDLDCIKRITISNKLPKIIFNSLEIALLKIAPAFKGKISHSTLFNNNRWVKHFTNQNGS